MDSDILLVDDNPAMMQVTARMLAGLGRLRFATSGAAALDKAREAKPDLVLLDVEMPEMNGHEVCARFKADPALQDVPVIFITSHDGQAAELTGLNAGAVDYIAKPLNAALLVARVRQHLHTQRRAAEMQRLVRVDALTEVANRHLFDETLEREWQRGLRNADPISLMLIDIDHYARYVSAHGQAAGDACLREVAQALQAISRRPSDLCARIGGKRFALLLPQTARANAEHLAHNALQSVELLSLAHGASPCAGHVTASIGVACYDCESPCWVTPAERGRLRLRLQPQISADALLASAQLALASARHHGKAQAWVLDISDLETPSHAHEIRAAYESARYAPV